MSQPVLSIEGAHKRFGPVAAVDGVDLKVSKGEFFALLGPSGSGKTTLLRIIAGLESPDEGRVLIDGQDVTRLAPYERQIGMVFQDFLLFPHKTVAENIAFPLKMQGLSRPERASQLDWVLSFVRLEGYEGRYPHQLSGGQKQRVALARGLIARPKLLLLDEPLANLDRELRKEMEIEVRRFQLELGIPFIYVTHNQEEALTMSDRMAVMRAGRFDQMGPKLEVYARPATPFVASFVGQANRMSGRLAASEHGLARLDWNGIALWVPAVGGIGDAVDYFVKSERIAMVAAESTAAAQRGENRLRGRIRDIIFKGQYADHLIRLDNGRELIVSAPAGLEGATPGGAIGLAWPAQAGDAFRADGSSNP